MPVLSKEEADARRHIAAWVRLYQRLAKEVLGMVNAQDFAASLGISKAHLSEVASGASTAGLKILLRLRYKYAASIDAVLDREPTDTDQDRARSDVSRLSALSHKHAAG
jgi:transcriptional regulator with XRE-family HTH domain